MKIKAKKNPAKNLTQLKDKAILQQETYRQVPRLKARVTSADIQMAYRAAREGQVGLEIATVGAMGRVLYHAQSMALPQVTKQKVRVLNSGFALQQARCISRKLNWL